MPNLHFEISIDGTGVKTLSKWGGGGGTVLKIAPLGLLDAEAGKFAGCVECKRENVLSGTLRKSFRLHLAIMLFSFLFKFLSMYSSLVYFPTL